MIARTASRHALHPQFGRRRSRRTRTLSSQPPNFYFVSAPHEIAQRNGHAQHRVDGQPESHDAGKRHVAPGRNVGRARFLARRGAGRLVFHRTHRRVTAARRTRQIGWSWRSSSTTKAIAPCTKRRARIAWAADLDEPSGWPSLVWQTYDYYFEPTPRISEQESIGAAAYPMEPADRQRRSGQLQRRRSARSDRAGARC